MFKKGDKVRCLESYEDVFTKGKVYVVRKDSPKDESVKIERDDRGSVTNGWGAKYFELVKENITQFKVGDMVRYKKGSREIIFEVVEGEFNSDRENRSECGYKEDCLLLKYPEGGCWFRDKDDFELVESAKSELKDLVERANDGLRAMETIRDKYRKQVTCGNEYIKHSLIEEHIPLPKGWTYRIKTTPTFEPFTVGQAWMVELKGDRLYIGCRDFDAKAIKLVLVELNNPGINNVRSATEGKFYSTRNGINFNSYNISWEEADKILAALEKAGI